MFITKGELIFPCYCQINIMEDERAYKIFLGNPEGTRPVVGRKLDGRKISLGT